MRSQIPAGFAPATLSAVPPGFSPAIPPVASVPTAPSALSQMGAGLRGGIAAAATGGQDIYNNVRNILLKLGAPINKAAGLNFSGLPASTTNMYNALNVPAYAQKGASGIMEKMIQYAPAMGSGFEGAESVISSEFGILPKLKALYTNAINDLSPRIANIGQQAAIGGALSQNPGQGAENFGTTQAVIESANPLLRLGMAPLHMAAELVHPSQAAQIFTNGLKNVYQNVAAKVKNAYSFMNPYKNELIDNPNNLIDSELTKYFPLNIKRKVAAFVASPTIENAHQLQSDMFTTANQVNPNTFDDLDKINALQSSREPLLNAITTKLSEKDPVAALNYNQGRYLVRNELAPLTPTPYFHNLANGEITGDDPQEIVRQYKKAFPTKSSLPNNYLSQTVPKLSQKTGMGQFAQYMLPMGLAAGLSHLGDLSGVGSGMTLAGSGAFARWAELPIVKNMLQNEALHHGLGKLGNIGRKVSAIVGPTIAAENTNSLNNMSQNNNSNS